jgi:hypothetical protein
MEGRDLARMEALALISGVVGSFQDTMPKSVL